MNPLFANIPDELKARPQWVVWRKVERDGKATKVPFTADFTGRHASTTDPDTWSTFDAAVGASHRFDGIGYVFSEDDPYTGIDWDCCLDGGEVLEWAAEKIAAFCPSYAEISPSGKGVKAIVRAKLPGAGTRRNGFGGDKAGAVEMYDRGRYFTITGDRWSDSECEVIDRQAAVDQLYREIHAAKEKPEAGPSEYKAGDWRPSTASLSDDEIVAKLIARGLKALDPDVRMFRDLYQNGDLSCVDDDESDADYALAKILAKWVGDDAPRIERIFNGSAIAERDKWRNRPNYRAGTIRKGIRDARVGFLSFVSFPSHGGDSEEWPEPIEAVRFPVPSFPLEVFPEGLVRLCRAGAESLDIPVDYLGALALGIASGALGQSTALAIKPGWEEAANIYLAIVGDPGSKKSPPLKILGGALWDINATLIQHSEAAHTGWKSRKEDAARKKEFFDEKEPPLLCAAVDDTTKEALATLIAGNPRGITMLKDELTALVASLNAYRGGKGDDLQFFLKLNTRSAVAVSRVKDAHRPIVIRSPCLTIVGCMTPETTASMLETRADNGWLDRFLFAFPDPLPAREEFDETCRIPEHLIAAWRQAVSTLHGYEMDCTDPHRPHPVHVVFGDGGMDAWKGFFRGHKREINSAGFPRSLKGPWSKMEGFCARIALTLAQLRRAYNGEERGPVDGVDVRNAARLIDYFKAGFRRIRGQLLGYLLDADDDTNDVIHWIRIARVESFTARDLLRRFRTFDSRRRDHVLRWLVDRQYVRLVPADPRRGRPSPHYLSNPYLWDGKDNKDKNPEDGTSSEIYQWDRKDNKDKNPEDGGCSPEIHAPEVLVGEVISGGAEWPRVDPDPGKAVRIRRAERWLILCLDTASSHPVADVLRWASETGMDESLLLAARDRNADIFPEIIVDGVPHWAYREKD